MHLSRDLMELVLRGETSAEALLRVALDHLFEHCEDCRTQWEEARRSAARGLEGGQAIVSAGDAERKAPPVREATLQQIKSQAAYAKRLQAERRRAKADLKALLDTPDAERRLKIENARSRFRSKAFAELLLEESRRSIRSDSKQAEQLARLVPVAIHWIAKDGDLAWAFKLTVRADTVRANAQRISGEFDEAEETLRSLRRRMVQTPILDSESLGDVDLIEASLLFARRRYEEAESLVDRAVLHYRLADYRKGVAQSLTLRGNIAFHDGRYQDALEAHSEAEIYIDPETESFLVQAGVTGRINTLCELGNFEAAQEMLAENSDLYRNQDTYTSALFASLTGTVHFGLGDADQAEKAYARCRDGYLEIGRNHDACLASLDVAHAMLVQGKTAEVTQMASEVLNVFQARGAEREALSTLRLIYDAAASETLTAAILRKARLGLVDRI